MRKGTYKKQIPKKQIPNNKETANPKFQKGRGYLEFGICLFLGFNWNLVFVIWIF